jgi:hypothetical protein
MLFSLLSGFVLGFLMAWRWLPRRAPAPQPAHEWAAFGQPACRIPAAGPGPVARDGCVKPGAQAPPDLRPGRIYLHSPP